MMCGIVTWEGCSRVLDLHVHVHVRMTMFNDDDDDVSSSATILQVIIFILASFARPP